MSEENVEVVKRGFEAWNRQYLKAVRACFWPDLEIDFSDRVLNPGVYHGVECFVRMRSEIGEAWDEWQIEVEELFAAGNDVVAFVISARGGC